MGRTRQMAPLHGHGSTLKDCAASVDLLSHHGVGQMHIFQCRFRIAVAEKLADGQHRLTPLQRDTGVRMPKVMIADAAQVCFRPHPMPDVVQAHRAQKLSVLGGGNSRGAA